MEFTPFPIIETQNLLLRRMDLQDVQDIFEMRNDPSMHIYTNTNVDKNSDETTAYIEKMNIGVDDGKWIIWAIEHKQSKKVIGSISIWNLNEEELRGELGYGIIPDFQGQGFMKEALLQVINFGFEKMSLQALDAYTEENNRSSIKLLETCEFQAINKVQEEGNANHPVFQLVVYRLVNKRKDNVKVNG